MESSTMTRSSSPSRRRRHEASRSAGPRVDAQPTGNAIDSPRPESDAPQAVDSERARHWSSSRRVGRGSPGFAIERVLPWRVPAPVLPRFPACSSSCLRHSLLPGSPSATGTSTSPRAPELPAHRPSLHGHLRGVAGHGVSGGGIAGGNGALRYVARARRGRSPGPPEDANVTFDVGESDPEARR